MKLTAHRSRAVRPGRRTVSEQTCHGRRTPSFGRHLVLMVKEPVGGRVKTRLGRQLGVARATSFYRHATAAVLARLHGGGRWRTLLAVSPDHRVGSPVWPMPVGRMPQGQGDLGQRMQRVMDELPPGPVVIIGTDIPGIRAEHISAAFARLGSHDAVFGPAPDGGYWLVGLRRMPRVPRAFKGVRWSAPETLTDTLSNLGGLDVARLSVLADVDEEQDYRACNGAHGRIVLPVWARV